MVVIITVIKVVVTPMALKTQEVMDHMTEEAIVPIIGVGIILKVIVVVHSEEDMEVKILTEVVDQIDQVMEVQVDINHIKDNISSLDNDIKQPFRLN